MATKPFAFSNDVILIVGGAIITGFADGDDVVIFAPNQDRITTRVGADGHATPAVNGNKLWDITIKLMDTAISNSIFQGLEAVQDQGLPIFPILMKDAAGTDLFESSSAWINIQSTSQYGQGANIREWGLQANDANYVFGGHV